MNVPATQPDEAERPRGATLKFTHPSGSRPLDGYTIKRGVGRGGFGEVYFATSDAGKEVALKLIRRNLDVELRGVTQCINLKHPNLVALYDIRTDEMGDQWVIMEFVSGESLEDVINRNPNGMALDEVLWWMRGMCAGVAYLHDHGIVHRDLKPGNIFSDDGTVKIGDYGLAKFISCSRRSGQTESVGTVHYMAPEIANGRYGREIDTYALGVILFEMLTGRVPFEGESVGEVLMKHLTAEADLSALEEPFRGIVQRALAKDPDVRIDSVSELMALLPGGDAPTSGPAVVRPAAFAAIGGEGAARANVASAPPAARGGEPPIEEPIWKSIRNGAGYMRRRWVGDGVPPLNAAQKIVLVVVLVALVTNFAYDSFDILLQIAIAYGVYYLVWASFIQPGIRRRAQAEQLGGRSALRQDLRSRSRELQGVDPADFVGMRASAQTAAWPLQGDGRSASAAPARKSKRRPSWRDRANEQLLAKPLREKFSELVTSMLLASAAAAVAAFVWPLLAGPRTGTENTAMYLWLAIVGTLGSWAVIVPSKFFEGRVEDQAPIRLTQLLLGAAVGFAAWFVADILLLNVPTWGDPVSVRSGLFSNEFLEWPLPQHRTEISPAYFIAYFAFLFLLPRWWRQTEFTRDSRVSLWWVIASVGWGWLLQFFWWFPQPAGMMAAGIIALATQLSCPWMPPSRRKALAAEIEGGVA